MKTPNYIPNQLATEAIGIEAAVCADIAERQRRGIEKYGVTVEANPLPPPCSAGDDDARIYPCADCGTLRTKAEGGTTFTVCDDCWDKHFKPSSPNVADETRRE